MLQRGVLQEHSSALVFLMRVLDLSAVISTGIVVYRFQFGSWKLSETYQLGIALGLICSVIYFGYFSLYRTWRGTSVITEVRTLLAAWGATSISVVFTLAVTGAYTYYQNNWLLCWMLMAAIFLVGFRLASRYLLRWVRAEGHNQRTVVIVGMSGRGLEIAERLKASAWTGLNVVGFFDERCPSRVEGSDKVKFLGRTEEIGDYVQREKIDQVWIVYPLKAEDRVKKVLHQLRHCTVDIRYVLDIFAFDLCNHSINEVAGIPILNVSASPLQGTNEFLKNMEDRFVSLLLLLMISPLLIAIAIGVKFSSPGPVFYRQERISRDNKPFMMLKFRSMPVEAEQESGPVWARKGENRATRFGAFLRKTSLDELPQFINVLVGDMSIVGPRPERSVFVDQFKEEIPYYMKKHMVKAGITGWAQVNGWRGDTDLNKRIEYDLHYINNWSLWLDLKIIFATIFKGFVHKNAY